MASNDLKYIASATVAEFLKDKSPRKILVGPVGSGKSVACIMHLLINAMQQEPDHDGVRRSRYIIVRNTLAQLKMTSLKTLVDWIKPDIFGHYLSTEKTLFMRFEDVESEIILLALEDEQDLRRLLSLEVTGIFLNEARELSEAVISGVVGSKRVGRFPSRKNGPGASSPFIIADSNMPNWGSYLQKIMTGEEGDWATFRQPGGRSLEAENLAYLPPDYYNVDGLTDEYVRTMVDCEYGTNKEGLPVFKDTFTRDFHTAGAPLSLVKSADYPLVIGLDAGLTPAAVLGQQTPTGKVHVLDECFTPKGASIGMERFLQTRLVPLLQNRFPGASVLVIVDPAAMQRSQATEETVFEIIKKAGFKVLPAPTNKIDLRIGSAETLFGSQTGGKAVVQIDPRCTGLLSALSSGYCYAVKRDGEVEDKPKKDHPASDIADAYTYFTSHISGPVKFNRLEARKRKVVSLSGWT